MRVMGFLWKFWENCFGPIFESVGQSHGKGAFDDLIPVLRNFAPGHVEDMGLKVVTRGSVPNTGAGSGLISGKAKGKFDLEDLTRRTLRKAVEQGHEPLGPLKEWSMSPGASAVHVRDTIKYMFPKINDENCFLLDTMAYLAYKHSKYHVYKAHREMGQGNLVDESIMTAVRQGELRNVVNNKFERRHPFRQIIFKDIHNQHCITKGIVLAYVQYSNQMPHVVSQREGDKSRWKAFSQSLTFEKRIALEDQGTINLDPEIIREEKEAAIAIPDDAEQQRYNPFVRGGGRSHDNVACKRVAKQTEYVEGDTKVSEQTETQMYASDGVRIEPTTNMTTRVSPARQAGQPPLKVPRSVPEKESEEDRLGPIEHVWSNILGGWINNVDPDETIDESRTYQRRRCRVNRGFEYHILRVNIGKLDNVRLTKDVALKEHKKNYYDRKSQDQKYEVIVAKTFVFYGSSSAFREGNQRCGFFNPQDPSSDVRGWNTSGPSIENWFPRDDWNPSSSRTGDQQSWGARKSQEQPRRSEPYWTERADRPSSASEHGWTTSYRSLPSSSSSWKPDQSKGWDQSSSGWKSKWDSWKGW